MQQRRLLVDMKDDALSVSAQAELLNLNRSGLYYHPVPRSEDDLAVKLRIDKIYTSYPMYGYRRICWYLNEKEHYPINHKSVLRHMQEMAYKPSTRVRTQAKLHQLIRYTPICSKVFP